ASCKLGTARYGLSLMTEPPSFHLAVWTAANGRFRVALFVGGKGNDDPSATGPGAVGPAGAGRRGGGRCRRTRCSPLCAIRKHRAGNRPLLELAQVLSGTDHLPAL